MELPMDVLLAVFRNDVGAIKAWFASGGKASARNKNRTLLQWALAMETTPEVLRTILDQDETEATINVFDANGWSAIHHAVILKPRADFEPAAYVAMLLERGADVNRRIEASQGVGGFPGRGHRCTPLIIAARYGDVSVLTTLLRSGASLEMGDCYGFDAEAWAIKLERHEAISLLSTVRLHGGWKSYVRSERVSLLVLRDLCARGRATPFGKRLRPGGGERALWRLFAPPRPGGARTDGRRRTRAAKRRAAHASLPKEVFWHVLAFWRCSRDPGWPRGDQSRTLAPGGGDL